MITSIRFIGGDLNKPAVFIILKSFELKNIDQINLISQIIKEEYAKFSPQRIRWFSKNQKSDFISKHASLSADLTYYCNFIKNIKCLALPQNYENIILRKPKNFNWFSIYEQEYQQLLHDIPGYEEMGEMESLDSFKNMLDNHYLFEVIIDGKWGGIIGAVKDQHLFMKGFEIYEEFLIKEFRGKNIASAMQRKFIDALNFEKDQMIYGTIHSDNIPSIKTAKRVGRKCAGLYIFHSI